MTQPTPETPLGLDLLNTALPAVDAAAALTIALTQFQLCGPASALPGERDRNFLLHRPQGGRAVLKFVSAAEPRAETELQIAVLRHLADTDAGRWTPRAIPATTGAELVDWRDGDAVPVRVRAYTYLEGRPATQVPGSAALRRALGHTLAALDGALSDFTHIGTQRLLLWDLMHLERLRPQIGFIGDIQLRSHVQAVFDAFTPGVRPVLDTLRAQAIHNDLSKSNFVIDMHDGAVLAGILDFGDMAHAPLVCDLAIAASYQMSDELDPLRALDDISEGFETLCPLTAVEREHLLDLVVARVAQRLVITEWRAHQFPANRSYILRHHHAASSLLASLMPIWRQRSRHALHQPV